MAVTAPSKKVEAIFGQILQLDEDSLWRLVCKLFPNSDEEDLEDIFDSILSSMRSQGPRIPADNVFTIEDSRRGITR